MNRCLISVMSAFNEDLTIKIEGKNYEEEDLNNLLVCVNFKTEQSFYGLNILKFGFS